MWLVRGGGVGGATLVGGGTERRMRDGGSILSFKHEHPLMELMLLQSVGKVSIGGGVGTSCPEGGFVGPSR